MAGTNQQPLLFSQDIRGSESDFANLKGKTPVFKNNHLVSLIGHRERTIQCADEILRYERSMVDLGPTDSVTPRPRHLANEILMLILTHLTRKRDLYRCSLGNRQLYMVANPMLWEELVFDYYGINVERFLVCMDQAPQRLHILGQYIRKLSLKNHRWRDHHFAQLIPYMSQLTHITMDVSVSILRSNLRKLGLHCPRLRSICLSSDFVDNMCFVGLGQHCRQLSHVEWDVRQLQSPAWLETLDCPLQHLKITKYGLPVIALDIPPEPIYPFQPTLWPNLSSLMLSPCDMDDATLIAMIQHHPGLQVLELTLANKLTKLALDAMMQLDHLVVLLVTDNPHLSKDIILWFVRNGPPTLIRVTFSMCGPQRQFVALDEHAIQKIRSY